VKPFSSLKVPIHFRHQHLPCRVILPNGITIVVVENHSADIIAARFFFRGGTRWEPRYQAGLFYLLSAVLTKGSDRLSSMEIAEKIESCGASLSAHTTSDYFLVSLKTIAADFAELLKLGGEIIRSPSFPSPEVELERRLALQTIRTQKEQPFSVAFNQLHEAIYQNHPYALPLMGTTETLHQLGRYELVRCHETYFRPDNLVVTIVGKISLDRAIALVEEGMGDWQSPPYPFPFIEQPTITPQPHHLTTIQHTHQAVIILGYLGASVQQPQLPHSSDYAALKLLSTYLGNGLSSRLFVELREKRGLAYDVSALYPSRVDPSLFTVYIGTDPSNTEAAITGLWQEVDRLWQSPLTDVEIQTVKNKLLGQYALGKQSNSQIAQLLGWYEIMGLGVEFDDEFKQDISLVTSSKALEVAERYLTRPYISLVGPDSSVSSLTQLLHRRHPLNPNLKAKN